jgi:hypothetical protein
MLSNLPNTRALLLGILFFKQAFTLTSAQHHGINTYAITLKYFFFCKSRYAENDFLEPIFGADNTLEIQSSRESTIWICSATHSGNEQYTRVYSGPPLAQNINQSHRCINIGGPNALLFYRPDTARVLSIG